MFRGPLLHLGTGLFARQLAVEHLGANGLALGAELLGEGLLLRRRVGAKAGAVASGEAGTSTGADPSAVASSEAGACTGADTGASAGTEALARTGGEAAALTNEASTLADALRHTHASSALTGKAAHLLPVFDALRLTTGEVVDSGERPGLQATLRESR